MRANCWISDQGILPFPLLNSSSKPDATTSEVPLNGRDVDDSISSLGGAYLGEISWCRRRSHFITGENATADETRGKYEKFLIAGLSFTSAALCRLGQRIRILLD
mmetsp:Transcript_26802/g.60137  ORF Transcript_26802/g.60137 Transcript_26802/m.60137 type:complete len:105 (+) Transcript_26802:695-1009(+)